MPDQDNCKNSAVMRVTMTPVWQKWTMMKSAIQSSAESEAKAMWADYGEYVKKNGHIFNEKTERDVDEEIDSTSVKPIFDHTHEDHHINTPYSQPHDHFKHHSNHNFERVINQTIANQKSRKFPSAPSYELETGDCPSNSYMSPQDFVEWMSTVDKSLAEECISEGIYSFIIFYFCTFVISFVCT